MLRVRVRVSIRVRIKVRVSSSISPYCQSAGPYLTRGPSKEHYKLTVWLDSQMLTPQDQNAGLGSCRV